MVGRAFTCQGAAEATLATRGIYDVTYPQSEIWASFTLGGNDGGPLFLELFKKLLLKAKVGLGL